MLEQNRCAPGKPSVANIQRHSGRQADTNMLKGQGYIFPCTSSNHALFIVVIDVQVSDDHIATFDQLNTISRLTIDCCRDGCFGTNGYGCMDNLIQGSGNRGSVSCRNSVAGPYVTVIALDDIEAAKVEVFCQRFPDRNVIGVRIDELASNLAVKLWINLPRVQGFHDLSHTGHLDTFSVLRVHFNGVEDTVLGSIGHID